MQDVWRWVAIVAIVGGCAKGGGGPATGVDGGASDGGAGDTGMLGEDCETNEDCPNDGIFCNGVLSCQAGRCVASAIPNCNDGVACTLDECVLTTDMCQNTPLSRMCPEGSTCVPGTGCVEADACEFDDDCSGDGIFCNGVEVCLGVCTSPGDPCDDENSCTLDECSETPGTCTNTPFEDARTNPMHCGTGANDCVVCDAPTAAMPNVVAACLDGACGFECAPGFFDDDDNLLDGCEVDCPTAGMPDEPDDGFADTNCDGVDGDVARAIFVSRTRGSDGNGGLTPTTAVASLARALEVYMTNRSRVQILVESGTYATSATVRVPSGVGLYGGYAGDFLSRTNSRAQVLASASVAVSVESLTTATVIDRFTFTTQDRLGPGESTIAGIVRDAFTHLTLRYVTFEAGRGGAGTPGTVGAPGSPGNPGESLTANVTTGGTAGSVGGGAGRSGRYRATGEAGFRGDPNDSSCGGNPGGASGSGGMGCGDGDPQDLAPGGDGGVGCNGPRGSHGGAGGARGTMMNDGTYVPANGLVGGRGGVGGGGGGGGAGGGENANNCCLVGCDYFGTGRAGGGGGGGGTGGFGGTPGTGGGASIGLLVSTSEIAATELRVTTVGGGTGGLGGAGGTGGTGGRGGTGASSTDDKAGPGGDGGDGGPGGNGGCGGGGGGPSVGIYGFGASSRITPATPVTIVTGPGGNGGSSCGNAGTTGLRQNSVDVVGL
ncbi:MAG: hypothetical protein H6720_24990 [Sandaracinus sp.]|nr:hypothetical protein [Sandaracinus sp.]